MANARSRFDTICEYLNRAHETATGTVYGKPCVMHHGRAFIAFHLDGMGFKVRGRIRLQALALTGAKFWDPLMPDRPDPDWVWIPSAFFLSWDRMAVEAFRQSKDQGGDAIGRVRPVQASAPLIVRPVRPVAAPTLAAASAPVSVGGSLANATLAATDAPAFVGGESAVITAERPVVRDGGPTPASRREAPPPPNTRPLPNWAERLKQLTGWLKWTTSGREG
jgi:hypothetical protein